LVREETLNKKLSKVNHSNASLKHLIRSLLDFGLPVLAKAISSKNTIERFLKFLRDPENYSKDCLEEMKDLIKSYDLANQIIGPSFKWEEFSKDNYCELIPFETSIKTLIRLLMTLSENNLKSDELLSLYSFLRVDIQESMKTALKSKNSERNFNEIGNFVKKNDSVVSQICGKEDEVRYFKLG
jgi:hypothetical protein